MTRRILPRVIATCILAGAAACASPDPVPTPQPAPTTPPSPPAPLPPYDLDPPHEGTADNPWPSTPLPEPQGNLGVDEPILGHAMGSQTWPAIAWNGSTYLAAWSDDRPGGTFGARVGPDGAALDPAVMPLPLDTNIDIASDGQDFLVVGREELSFANLTPALVAVRVSADGALLGRTEIALPSVVSDVRVASSGAGYLVTWVEKPTQIAQGSLRVARVALDGTILDPGGVLLDGNVTTLAGLAFDGSSYVAAWSSMTHASGRAATFDAAGALVQETSLPFYPEAVECDDDGSCLVVWENEGAGWDPWDLRVSWMTAQGAVSDPVGAQLTPSWTSDGRVAIGFGGERAVVAWSLGSNDCSTDATGFTQVTKDGVVLTPGGALLQSAAGDPAMAGDGERVFAVWSDDRNDSCGAHASIFGARIAQDGAVLDANGVLVSRGANGQFNPSLAFDGENFIVTWTDERDAKIHDDWNIYATRVSPEGVPLDPLATVLGQGPTTQAYPRALLDGSTPLVAWWDCFYPNEQEIECNLTGARLDQSGADPVSFPFMIYEQPRAAPALSSGVGSTLVTGFVDAGQPMTAPVGPTGVQGPEVWPTLGFSTRVASASDGASHLVVWNPQPKVNGSLLGARVAADGTVLDPAGFAVTPAGSEVQTFAVAFGGGEYLVAWYDTTTDLSRILATRVSPEGVVLDAEPFVVAEHPDCAPPQTIYDLRRVRLGDAAVAFDGQRFVLGWRACGPDSDDLFGAIVDVGGVVRAQFPITADAHPDEAPALGGTGAGTALIAYSSFRAEHPLGAWRVFTWPLDAQAVLDGAAP